MIDNKVEQFLSLAAFASQKPEELTAGVYHISALERDRLWYAFVGGTYEFGESSVYPDRPHIRHDLFEITTLLSLCGYEVCLVLQVEHARWEQEFRAFNQKVAAHTASMAGASIDIPCFVYLAGFWAGASAAANQRSTPPSADQSCLFVTNIPGGNHELSIVELVGGLKNLFLALDMATLVPGTHKQQHQELARILDQHCSLTFFTFANAADNQFANQLTTEILDTLLKPEKIEQRRLVLRSNQFPRTIREAGRIKGRAARSHPLPYTVLSAPATALIKFAIKRLNPKKHDLTTSISKMRTVLKTAVAQHGPALPELQRWYSFVMSVNSAHPAAHEIYAILCTFEKNLAATAEVLLTDHEWNLLASKEWTNSKQRRLARTLYCQCRLLERVEQLITLLAPQRVPQLTPVDEQRVITLIKDLKTAVYELLGQDSWNLRADQTALGQAIDLQRYSECVRRIWEFVWSRPRFPEFFDTQLELFEFIDLLPKPIDAKPGEIHWLHCLKELVAPHKEFTKNLQENAHVWQKPQAELATIRHVINSHPILLAIPNLHAALAALVILCLTIWLVTYLPVPATEHTYYITLLMGILAGMFTIYRAHIGLKRRRIDPATSVALPDLRRKLKRHITWAIGGGGYGMTTWFLALGVMVYHNTKASLPAYYQLGLFGLAGFGTIVGLICSFYARE